MIKIKSIVLFIILFSVFSCIQMTKKEKELIYSADTDTPMRVLLTTDTQDSLFLRQKSKDIRIAKAKDLKYLIERMKITLEVENGVGIAAPQVGIGRNIFLFVRIDKPDYPVEVAINPVITAHSEEMICFEGDGCLSVPDMSGDSYRYAWIDVEYYNENLEKVQERLSGSSRGGDFTGVIFQHEFDHLQGVLFIDRLTPPNLP